MSSIKRSYMALLMTFLMATLLFPTFASAEEGSATEAVAKINTIEYATIQAAVTAATSGDTIVLTKDVAYGEVDVAQIVVPHGKSITLDLAGHAVSATDAATGSFALIENRGDLTVVDSSGNNGSLQVTANTNRGWGAASCVILNASDNADGGSGKVDTLTVAGGTVKHLGGTDMAYAIDNNSTTNDAVVNLAGGVIDSPYVAVRNMPNSYSCGFKTTATINVSGEALVTGKRSIWMQDAGATPAGYENVRPSILNISGGTLKATERAIYADPSYTGTEINISGGSIVCDNSYVGGTAGAIRIEQEKTESGKCVLNITGGEIKNNGGGSTFTFTGTNMFEKLNVTGATIVANDKDDLEVSFGGSNAVEFWRNTVSLGADIDLGDFTGNGIEVPEGANIELDLAGRVLAGRNGNETASTSLIANKGWLVVSDSSEAQTGKIVLSDTGVKLGTWAHAMMTISNFGTLNIKGGTIENTGGTDIPYAIDNNSTLGPVMLGISGGVVSSTNKTAVRAYANSTTDSNYIAVRGGEVRGGTSGIWLQQPTAGVNTQATLMISGGTIVGGSYNGVYVDAQVEKPEVSVLMTDGTIANNSAENAPIAVYDGSAEGKVVKSALIAIGGGRVYNGNTSGPMLEVAMSDGVLVNGGYFSSNPANYVAKGYVAKEESTVDEAQRAYAYHVVELTNASADVKVVAADPVVADPDITDKSTEVAEAMSAAADALKADSPAVSGLQQAAVSIAQNETVTAEDGAKALNETPELSDVKAEDVTIYEQPYLDIKITDAKVEDGTTTELALEITPWCKTVASTAKSAADIVESSTETATKNAVQVGNPVKMEVTDPITITLKLPKGFSTTDMMVRHTKQDGTVYYYAATIKDAVSSDTEKYATFTVTHGFSDFLLRAETRAAQVSFAHASGTAETISYSARNVEDALPLDTLEGSTFLGWKFAALGDDVAYTKLTDGLLTALSAKYADTKQTLVATPAWQAATDPGTGGAGESGGSGAVSGGSTETVSLDLSTASATQLAKTGDNTMILVAVVGVLCAAAAAVLVVAAIKRRRS